MRTCLLPCPKGINMPVNNQKRFLPAIIISLSFLLLNHIVVAQSLPAGFSQVQVAGGISNPTVMAFAPDGRIFVAQQSGQLRIIKNGSLLSQPFLSIAVSSSGERGLLGIAFDPNFNSNHYIYVYYTVSSGAYNRISRFTANGDFAVSGSEQVILNLDPLSSATNHNGGTMMFGPDGKLYIGVGENANTSYAQSTDTYHGKLLRINPDGSVPPGNPFASGGAQEQRIWAYGLRNPYTITFQPGTGRLFVNDVGGASSEEINDATAGGKNFGWPQAEGYDDNSSFADPVYAYGHGSGNGSGCAITGGTFFNPSYSNYPSTYTGRYFYIDYCRNWIDMLTLNGSSASRSNFAGNIAGSPVSLTTGTDGNLYFLSRNNSAVYKIVYAGGGSAPIITNQPINVTVAQGSDAVFSVTATGTAPLSYQWRKNGVNINGATGASYTMENVADANEGTYSVIVSNASGTVTSNNATLTVTAPNQPPVATISTPAAGATYAGGTVINFSGNATDPENGTLTGSSFIWYVIFHHDTHTHPGPSATTGATSGSFTIPNAGETASNVFYRLYLVVTDPQGAKDTVYRDIVPRTSTITLNTSPQGLTVTLDGQPFTAPLTVTGVEGIMRSIGTTSAQTLNSVAYNFSNWSHGGAQTQTFATPVNDVTYTANFTAAPVVPTINAQPQSQTVLSGNNATFSVTASGTAPLQYQWRKNAVNIAGATSSSYTISSVEAADEGSYSVIVSNEAGSVTSNSAMLTITSSPLITNQPDNITVVQGSSASFSVTATGTAPLSYQWRSNGIIISGATNSSFTISPVSSANAGNYSVVVSNAYGSVTSNAATLTVTSAPVIVDQPESITVALGSAASFSVTSTGTTPLSYQWRKDGTIISGATNSSYTISSASFANAGSYSVVVSNAHGSMTSSNATLTVTSAPVITDQPENITVAEGGSASFSVTATGTAPLSYQWRKDGSNITGATNSSYNISSVLPDDAAIYSVVISNAYGSTTSNNATLTITFAPVITDQPESIEVAEGSSASFSVTATGTAPLSYQWRKDGSNITGATNSSYNISSVLPDDAAIYSVVISNAYGSTTSNNATLTITFAPVITDQPESIEVAEGSSASFSVTATGTAPLSYQWKKEGSNIIGATNSTYNISSVSSANEGIYSVEVSNAYGSVTSNNVTLSIAAIPNQAPVATITSPVSGTTYAGGDVINYSGTGNDPDDGNINESAFTWFVIFYHGEHSHAGPALVSGETSGSFTIPNTGETATDVFYRLHLVVTDEQGLSDTTYTDIHPRTSALSFNTIPEGLNIVLDGTIYTSPVTVISVEGILRTISTPSPQALGEGIYYFSNWSQGGEQAQTIVTPAGDAGYTAVFTPSDITPLLRDPDNPFNVTHGLDYSYYHGTWKEIPDFSNLYKQKVGTVVNFDLSPRTENSNFAFHFSGYISVPADGVYTFHTLSDEGSQLYIGDSLIVNNDSLHNVQERSGQIGLKAGLHRISVAFFENTGDQLLNVSYEGAGISKQLIPDSVLFREQPTQYVFTPIADAYVQSGKLLNVNLSAGATPSLMAGGNSATADEYQTYLRFDISSLGSDISSVKLRMYGSLANINDSSAIVEVYNVPNWSGWLENTITFSNKPPAEGASLASVTVSGTDSLYYEWDLTNHITELRNRGVNYVSLMLKNISYSADNLVSLNSRENPVNKPELVVSTNSLVTEARPAPVGQQVNVKPATITIGSDLSFSIYPNPVRNSFTIKYSPAFGNRRLLITDVSGLVVKNVVLTESGTQTIRVDNLKQGVYFIGIYHDNKKYSQKIIVRQ